MRKRISSLGLALVMLFGLIALPASAADEAWTVTGYGTAATDTDSFNAKITTEYRYGGNNAMFIKANADAKDAANYLEIKNKLKEPLVKDSTYKLVLMNKLESSKYTEITFGDLTFMFKKDSAIVPTVTADEDGWSKYEYSFTYTGEAVADYLYFRFYRSITEQVIDDVALYKDGSDENLVTDGGFEGSDDIDRGEGEYDTSVLQPRNMLCSPTVNGIALNWINPTSTELSKITVYDITSEEALLTDSISTTPGGVVLYPITGLKNGSVYQYKIVFSYKTKPDYVYYLTGTPIDTSSVMIKDTAGAWTLIRRRNTSGANYTPGYACIDPTVSRSGSASMKLVANITDAIKSNTYVGGFISTGMESDKRYEVTFYAKAQNLVGTPQATMNFKKFEDNQNKISAGTDWTKNTFYYSGSETDFYICLDGMCDGLWIDDVEIYEVDKSGNRVTGENILTAGGFEGIASANADTVASLTAAASDYGARLSWTNTSSDCKAFNIYRRVFDEWQWRGTLSNAYSAFELDDLATGTDYEFAIAPVNSNYQSGAMAEVKFTTTLAKSTITDSTLYQGKDQVTGIDGEGEYTVVTRVNNYGYEDGLTVTQCVAVYDANDMLIAFKTDGKTVEKGKVSTDPTKLSTTFELAQSGKKIVVYILDTTADMNILRASECFE